MDYLNRRTFLNKSAIGIGSTALATLMSRQNSRRSLQRLARKPSRRHQAPAKDQTRHPPLHGWWTTPILRLWTISLS